MPPTAIWTNRRLSVSPVPRIAQRVRCHATRVLSKQQVQSCNHTLGMDLRNVAAILP